MCSRHLKRWRVLERFRVSSIEATFITEEMIEFFSSSRKFCRHLHVPLQSGDDDVLLAMRRPYTRGQYMDLIARLGDRIHDVGIGADVMVGVPGRIRQGIPEYVQPH